MQLILKFNIFLAIIIIFLFSNPLSSHGEVKGVIKDRHMAMSKIKNFAEKSYKQIAVKKNTENLDEYADELLKNAQLFIKLFPEGSEGDSSSNIWNEDDLFLEYNEKFVKDIISYKESITSEEIESIQIEFNKMASNCGICHKKFKK